MRMQLLLPSISVLALASLSACAEPVDEESVAVEPVEPEIAEEVAEAGVPVVANLVGLDGTEYGTATISEGSGGLELVVSAKNMEPGPHGAHIHTIGSCEAPDYKSAGGHWNPSEKEHGLENPEGSHFGDFPNLEIGEDGTGTLEATIADASLKDGDNPLLDEDGAAFVFHAGPDDQKTDPAGDAGSRVACGVFG